MRRGALPSALGARSCREGPLSSSRWTGISVGDTVGLSGPGTIQVEASAESISRLESLEIVVGGRVVASTDPPRAGDRLALNEQVPDNQPLLGRGPVPGPAATTSTSGGRPI